MFGRKFKADYKSKFYVGFEEGSNIAIDITLPPKNNLFIEILGTWFIVGMLSSLILGDLGGLILGTICAIITFHNSIEKIDIDDE